MKKNRLLNAKNNDRLFFSFFLSLSLLIILFAVQNSAQGATQTPSCTCTKGTDVCTYNPAPTPTTTTIWVKGNNSPYTIQGGDDHGDSYDPGSGDVLYGTAGPDLIIGSSDGDIIRGLGGDDTICGEPDTGGGAGADEIYGGAGNDYICGGNQDDKLYGGSGNDVIEGNNGQDVIEGGDGDDCLYGGNANDDIGGGSGSNYIDGGNGKDECSGAEDMIHCEEGSGVPDLQLEKRTEGQGADTAPGPLVASGETVNWTYEVTNAGNAMLKDVTVTDDMGDSTDDDVEICPKDNSNDGWDGELSGGDSHTCIYSGTAEKGQYSNMAEVTGTTGNTTYTVTDPSHYFGTEFDVTPQDSPLEAQITQEGNLDAWNSGTISNIQFTPHLEVTFAYPAGYDVEVDYTVDLTEASPSSLTNDPLILDSSKNHGGDISEKYIPRDGNGTLKLRAEGDFGGELTQNDGDFTQKYDLFVDPKKLIEDYAAEDILTFTVNFTVSENST